MINEAIVFGNIVGFYSCNEGMFMLLEPYRTGNPIKNLYEDARNQGLSADILDIVWLMSATNRWFHYVIGTGQFQFCSLRMDNIDIDTYFSSSAGYYEDDIAVQSGNPLSRSVNNQGPINVHLYMIRSPATYSAYCLSSFRYPPAIRFPAYTCSQLCVESPRWASRLGKIEERNNRFPVLLKDVNLFQSVIFSKTQRTLNYVRSLTLETTEHITGDQTVYSWDFTGGNVTTADDSETPPP